MTGDYTAGGRMSALAVSVDTNFVIVAIIAALATIALIRIEVDAAPIVATKRMTRIAYALSRNALIVAARTAFPAAHGIRRKITTTDFLTTLRLSRSALALSGHARTRTAIYVAHPTTRWIRGQITASELIPTNYLALCALALARYARAISAIDVALTAMFAVLRKIETSGIAFHGALGACSTLTRDAILTCFARFGARSTMRGVIGEIKAAIDA